MTLIFIIGMVLTLKRAELSVTNDEFTIKYWFLTFKIKISDIELIEIKDVDLLPEPYRGHIKIYLGVEFLEDLKVFKLRKGDAVHIKTKSGQIFIITPEDNQKLFDALNKKSGEN